MSSPGEVDRAMERETLTVRVIVPDLWREQRMEFGRHTAVGDIKQAALPTLLGRDDVDPSAYYVEYFEKEVLDESRTLADLGVPEGGVISLRAYDLDHPPPFEG